jgi:hypothetical protein
LDVDLGIIPPVGEINIKNKRQKIKNYNSKTIWVKMNSFAKFLGSIFLRRQDYFIILIYECQYHFFNPKVEGETPALHFTLHSMDKMTIDPATIPAYKGAYGLCLQARSIQGLRPELVERA